MLNLLVRAFSSCIGGESGTSWRRTSCDKRELGMFWSLCEVLKAVEGGTREAVLGRRGSSSLRPPSPFTVVGPRRPITLRRWSRGMAGTCNYRQGSNHRSQGRSRFAASEGGSAQDYDGFESRPARNRETGAVDTKYIVITS